MKRKGLIIMFILGLITSLALVGCSDKPSTSNDPEKPKDDTSENAEPKTLIFARGGENNSLDFASTTDGETSRVTMQIFESLLEYDKDSFNVKPGLASDWKIEDDGTRYILDLVQGVKFHDGTDFNADAVIFNYERWADKNHPHHYADEGFAYTFYQTLFGGHKGDAGHIIKEINKLNDHQVEFVLTKPYAPFIQNLAMASFAIASPKSFEDYGSKIIENPVGTGPFMFKEWKRNESITLVKNPNYWKEGLPKLDTVIFKTIPDNSARYTALKAGQIDIMDGLNPDDVNGVESDSNLKLYKRTANNVGYLGFNTQKAPFDDPKVRVAMNYAVNKEALITGLYNNLAVPAKGALPPGYLGYNDSVQEYSYNPEKAKQLLAEAGYEEGFTFDLWTMPVARPYMPDPQKAAEVLQADFAKIGLTANIVSMEWATYLDETTKGKHDVFMLGWSGTNGDPDYFLNPLLSKNSIPGGNRAQYANDEVTELLIKATEVTDVAERESMYQKALEIMHNEAPWIPLVHNTPVLASGSNVLNYVPHPSTSESLAEVDLE